MSSAWLDQVTQIRAQLGETGYPPSELEIAQAVSTELPLLGSAAKIEVFDQVTSHINGLGPLAKLAAQPGVTDILVNGPSQVWYDSGHGLVPTDITWPSEAQLREFVVHLAAQVHQRLDDAHPFVDARLPSGIRLHGVIPPLSQSGTCLSLRIPARQTMTLGDLQSHGMFDHQTGQLLEEIVASGVSFLICGGTGSGKTTLLAAMLSQIAQDQRILVVEDLQELIIEHSHVVSLQSRQANTEAAGEVSMRSLIRQALRMRPDRLILGEVRGAEIVDLFTAFNTGHEGGCATVHANSAADVPARIEALGLLANIPRFAIHSLFATAISLVIELGRTDSGLRKVTAVHQVSLVDGLAQTRPVFDRQVDEGNAVIPDELIDALSSRS